jgi:hypothetical protein
MFHIYTPFSGQWKLPICGNSHSNKLENEVSNKRLAAVESSAMNCNGIQAQYSG